MTPTPADRSPGRCSLRVEGQVLTGVERLPHGVVLVEAGRVLWVGPAAEAPATTPDRCLHLGQDVLVPGFVDLHVHGGGGRDVLDGTKEALSVVRCVHAHFGTTALYPTVATAPPAQMLRALERINEVVGAPMAGAGRVLGANLEGPFISAAHAGAQAPQFVQPPDPVLLEELLAAAGGSLRIMTLAPELPGAMGLVRRLRDAGVTAAMGHSGATYAETQAAIEAGCRLSTHTCNGMRALHHREVGIAGAALLSADVVAEAIADGRHLSPPMLEMLWRMKGPTGLALVTDCTAALEAHAGEARLGSAPLSVDEAGCVRDASGRLAGTTLTMAAAVRRFALLVDGAWPDVVVAATATPAAVAACDDVGMISVGRWADFVVLNDRREVCSVWVGGEPVDLARPGRWA